MALTLALELAETFIRIKLRVLAMTHLYVRTQSNSLVIYSMERNEEAIRGILTHSSGNEFILSIANHRGKWELIPFVGELAKMMDLLTEDLTFALARWSESEIIV
ncbi:hypothetical protein [Cohnella sp.]|uniref:hypothetical protein n=1 Tax=Cohnella sp. TaxID=1883426 RepID=UPI0035617F6D